MRRSLRVLRASGMSIAQRTRYASYFYLKTRKQLRDFLTALGVTSEGLLYLLGATLARCGFIIAWIAPFRFFLIPNPIYPHHLFFSDASQTCCIILQCMSVKRNNHFFGAILTKIHCMHKITYCWIQIYYITPY